MPTYFCRPTANSNQAKQQMKNANKNKNLPQGLRIWCLSFTPSFYFLIGFCSTYFFFRLIFSYNNIQTLHIAYIRVNYYLLYVKYKMCKVQSLEVLDILYT